MLPSDIHDVFGTLFTGLLAVIGLVAAARVARPHVELPDSWMVELFGSIKAHGAFGAFLVLLLAFGIGVVAEGTTDVLTDFDTEYGEAAWYHIPAMQQRILRKEEDHRFFAAYKPTDGGYKPTGLGKAIMYNDGYLLAHSTDLKIFTHRDSIPDSVVGDAKDVVNKMYYTAKNWSYKEATYFRELERIQRRIDWSRSMFLLASWVVVLVAILAAITIPSVFVADKVRRLRGRTRLPARQLAYESLRRTFIIIGLAVIAAGVSRLAHNHAELQFNERAFGYYVSSLEQAPPIVPQVLANVLWMQTAAEYHAIARQTFKAAEHAVRKKLERPPPNPAVVLDLDETVIDNLQYNFERARAQQPFSAETWAEWVDQRIDDMEAVPGARDFVKFLRRNGVTVAFVSNRLDTQRSSTIDALVRLGIMEESDEGGFEFFLQTDGTAKGSRLADVSSRYEVLAYVGDQLGDFDDDFQSDDNKVADRWRTLCSRANVNRLGEDWFLLPNPVYGEWMSMLRWDNPSTYFYEGLRSELAC